MNKTISEFLECRFTDAEGNQHGKDLAIANERCAELELRKKAVDAQIKSDIEAQKAEISKLVNFIRNGTEHRMVECEVVMNHPRTGVKTVRRLDTGAVVRELRMAADEMQETLPFDAPAEPAPPADPPATGRQAVKALLEDGLPTPAITVEFLDQDVPAPASGEEAILEGDPSEGRVDEDFDSELARAVGAVELAEQAPSPDDLEQESTEESPRGPALASFRDVVGGTTAAAKQARGPRANQEPVRPPQRDDSIGNRGPYKRR